MKKLMIAAAVMCLGLAAQAESWVKDWSCSSSTYMNYTAYVMKDGNGVADLFAKGDNFKTLQNRSLNDEVI